ncbi:invasion protein IalB [Rhodovulum imhoffii]|uniref:Invasion protein IalB n=1 Tax=Rhodovulum imhoffii TaxID=365340 RepID=A0A2T5BUH8_9RHOB|nr:invasion associated locus B family protein [Rhodovulum imhoffii]PTN03181.1 invasion protein IalB [Rhodovulum imhoffii]
MTKDFIRTLLHGTILAWGVAIVPAAVQVARAETPNATPEASARVFGTWTVRCRAQTAGAAPDGSGEAPGQVCEMGQTLSDEKTGRRILALSVQEQDEGLVLVILGPFGLDLNQQAQMLTENGVFLNAKFRTCVPAGCILRADLTPEAQKIMSQNETLTIGLPRLDEAEPLRVTFANAGFAAALSDLTSE